MSNQSLFVKIVIWFMVFLMSAGFAALVIAPFASNTSFFGGSSGRDATRELVDDARADIKKDDCTDTKDKPTGKRLARCKDAFERLASSYTTLARPEDANATEAPRDSKRNLARAHEAWKALYTLDPKDEESAVRYASSLRENSKTEQSLAIFNTLVKAHPQNEDYLLQVAATYSQLSKLDEAIATYNLFIKRFPESGQLDQIKEEIKNLQDQKAQQAAGGGQQPISVG